jgi:hypothetical protein
MTHLRGNDMSNTTGATIRQDAQQGHWSFYAEEDGNWYGTYPTEAEAARNKPLFSQWWAQQHPAPVVAQVPDRSQQNPDGSWCFAAADGVTLYGPYPDKQTAVAQQSAYDHHMAETNATATPPTAVDADALVAEVLAARDAVAVVEKRHKLEKAAVVGREEKAEATLLNYMNETKQLGFKAASGSVATKELTRPAFGDKEEALRFIRETGNIELLGARISSTAVEAWIKTHEGNCPPGITVSKVRSLSITRNKT